MTRKKNVILPFSLCKLKILDIPPVKEAQAGQIIRHRISAFYPGDADDLYIDFIKDGEKTLVFYAGKDKIDRLREEEGNCSLYSLWHLFSGIREKQGYYGVLHERKIELLLFENDLFVSRKYLSCSPGEVERLKSEGTVFLPDNQPAVGSPLFEKKRKKNYPLLCSVLFTLLVLLLPLNLYRQVKSEERHVYLLKQDVAALSANKSQALPSEEEYSDLLNQYGGLVASRPPDVSLFFHELAESLGEGVTLDNLVLKNNSFQLKGEAENPLGRMESFRENGSFSKVLPYQIKPVEGSVKQSFSLTGVFEYE